MEENCGEEKGRDRRLDRAQIDQRNGPIIGPTEFGGGPTQTH